MQFVNFPIRISLQFMNASTLLALSSLTLPISAKQTIFEPFESDGFGEWKEEGPAFGKSPTAASPEGLNGTVNDYGGQYYVSSAHGGDAAAGTLTSPEFTISQKFLSFLISGGSHPGKTAVQLYVDGNLEMQISGKNDLTMRPVIWDLSRFNGQKAQIKINDDHRGGWGIINADHFVFSDSNKITFPKTKDPKKPAAKGDLVSTDAIPGVTVVPGTALTIFSENATSGLYSPTALTVAEDGAVFVAETHRFRHGIEDNRNHLYWLMDDMAAMTTADRVAMHKKWSHKKISVEKMTEKTEKIRVLVDTNGDGVADKHEVFADKFNDLLDGTAAGIMAFEGEIYFACIPKIWSLKDKNGDLVADDYKTIQDGFGVRVSFSGHDLNGFALGPDGRLYTTIGDRGFAFTTKEGREYSFPGQGAILRFEPDGSNMEVVHTGLRNPKEIAFDQWGTAVSVDNNSDQGDQARVVVMMDGADSGWRMGHQVLHSFHRTAGIPDRPVNRWMQEKMWQPYNESQPAYILPPIQNLTSGPSGLAYHPGTGYGLDCQDQFLICDYRGGPAASGIWRFGISPAGAGFKVSDSAKFNWGAAVTDVEWGYDGKIYVADFITGWTSHEAGRVYTLSQPGLAEDQTVNEVASLFKKGFSTFDSNTLARLLKHPDQRVRLRAQYHLVKKPEALALFTAAANQRLNEMERLHGVWGLGMLARLNKSDNATNFLARLLSHKDAHVRGQTAQALGESTLSDSSILIPLLKDSSTRVQALAALALNRKPHPAAVTPLVDILIQNNNDDPYLRHAVIMGLVGCAGADGFADLLKHESPAVRLASVVGLRRLRDDRLVLALTDKEPKISDEVIRAIHDLSIETVRPALAALLDDYATGGPGRKITPIMMRRLIHSGYRIGGEKNMARLVKIATNEQISMTERKEVLRLLSLWAEPHIVDQSIGKYAPLPKRDPAVVKSQLEKNFPALLNSGPAITGLAMKIASQYKIDLKSLLDSGKLTHLIRDEKIEPATRVEALKQLLETTPEHSSELLTEAAQSKNDLLANAALELAAKRNPRASVAAVIGALKSESITRRQKAWEIAATLPAEFSVPLIRDGLTALTTGKGDLSSALELLAAAKQREEPAIKSALESYQGTLKEDAPLDHWAPTFSGGNADRGFKIFQSHGAAQCMRCHRYAGGHSEGGNAGPNLAGIALRQDARALVESLIDPGAKIASGFGLATVTLKNGEEKTGMILKESDSEIDFKEGETVWKIATADLTKTTILPSAMPAMGALLKPVEMRDLVAWLLTLTKESGETSAAYEAKELIVKAVPPKPAKTEPTKSIVSTEKSIDPAIMELGKSLYDKPGSCVTCHQPNGAGMPGAFPPLTNSEWVSGPVENLVRIQLHGLQGPIKVNGQDYQGVMMPVNDAIFEQSDENIAAVLTYVRNSFGHSSSAVTPEDVAKHRGEKREGMLTEADLIDPATYVAPPEPGAGPPILADIPSSGLGASIWGISTFLIIGALTLVGVLGMKAKG
ncbi:MAG: c-type cytochrome [Akkermansiaceae bacterium]